MFEDLPARSLRYSQMANSTQAGRESDLDVRNLVPTAFLRFAWTNRIYDRKCGKVLRMKQMRQERLFAGR